MADNNKDDFFGKKETTGYAPPSPELSKWMHDFEKELQWDLMARFKGGYTIVNEKGELDIEYPPNHTQWMNDRGIAETMSIVSLFLSKMHGLSAYDEDRIKEICWETANALARHYAVHMNEYALSPTKASVIIRGIMNYFESDISKSKSGLALRLASTMEKRVESVSQAPDSKKRMGYI